MPLPGEMSKCENATLTLGLIFLFQCISCMRDRHVSISALWQRLHPGRFPYTLCRNYRGQSLVEFPTHCSQCSKHHHRVCLHILPLEAVAERSKFDVITSDPQTSSSNTLSQTHNFREFVLVGNFFKNAKLQLRAQVHFLPVFQRALVEIILIQN